MGEQGLVHGAEKARAEWQSAGQFFEAAIKSGDAAAHFACVVEWNARLLISLIEEEIGERRLGTLDLGRKDGLLPDKAVEEERDVGEVRRNGVETSEGDERIVEPTAERG
jgi:hypothetical protein